MSESEILFETERLFARRLSQADAAEMAGIFGDIETMRYVGDSKPITEADCLYWVVDVTAKNFEKRGYGLIGFFDKSAGVMVACGGVFHPGQQPEPEVMYHLHRDWWGNGYATELVKGLAPHAKINWGITWMMATIHPDNLPSQRVMIKCGFTHTKDRTNEDGSVTQIWEMSQ
jgi:[ribosomal protein S5]-alanine N-acetyltransferase